ncbi:hypothetical protein [Prosthecobacter sp.]|uniref:putative polyvalent protein kinase domain-containing protein n=1 Tax=Prosthecobacter sp. TaxID=1965333 RepID=UPI0037831915
MHGEPPLETSHPDQGGSAAGQALDHEGTSDGSGLQAALDVLGGESGADQPEPWTPSGYAVVRDQQIGLLSEWAASHGFWISQDELGRRNSGRMEHAVFGGLTAGKLAFKATKGTKFGFWPFIDSQTVSTRLDEYLIMRPGTPAQYLLRLLLLNILHPDLNRLKGFAQLDGHFSIITSQPWYDARNAAWAEIKRWLSDLGFKPVRDDIYSDPVRWYNAEQNLALFDVGESNVLYSDGQLVPIDIIPVRPQNALREALERF